MLLVLFARILGAARQADQVAASGPQTPAEAQLKRRQAIPAQRPPPGNAQQAAAERWGRVARASIAKHTARAPPELVRTFQINQLFANMRCSSRWPMAVSEQQNQARTGGSRFGRDGGRWWTGGRHLEHEAAARRLRAHNFILTQRPDRDRAGAGHAPKGAAAGRARCRRAHQRKPGSCSRPLPAAAR